MLTLYVNGQELFNETTNEIITVQGQELTLEHSLVSIFKWESKWNKPFLEGNEKTDEEFESYIHCMCVNKVKDENIFKCLTLKDKNKIKKYMSDPHSATWFNEKDLKNKKGYSNSKGTIVTAELIYFWMIEYNIPEEYQKWHINNLMNLIRICEIKGSPSKKMSQKDILTQNTALNAARRKKFNSKG